MGELFVTYLRPHWRILILIAFLLLIQAIANLFLPSLNADIINDGVVKGDTISGTGAAAQKVFDDLEAIGIDLRDVFIALENEGVEKFEASWHELLEATQGQLDAAAK